MYFAQEHHRWDNLPKSRRPLRTGALLLAALALSLLCYASAAAAQTGQGWRIQVRNAACVPGAVVHLGEIADAGENMPPQLWKELSRKALWPAPEKPGRQTALTRERLSAMLRHYVGEEAWSFVLPQQLVVQRGGKAVDGATLTRKAVDFLTEGGTGLGGELEITDLRTPDYVFLPHPGDHLNLTMSETVRPGRNNLLFEVVSGEGKTMRRFAGSAFVNVWRAVACATRPINRLELVTPDMVTFKRKNMAYYQKAWDGSGGPWRVARSVGTDQVINVESIELVPVIAKGGTINLIYEGANIRLSVKAVALADAGVGQMIQVRNVQSNRKITGTVLDAETVLVR
ncbi:MAG: flagellar basal body P-ring formation chaperone FlgA [Proteobacteria bacterium]|nr:flagellar basal body P-ring formation chaperone FlgA [Pseudomonadota bacterium]